MPVFKCKMCGGSLEVTEGMTVCECEYCGIQQTLPKTDNEQNLNLFNRANHFRQQCEFDKAAEIYEKMAGQSGADAELYWSIVLCRYGIEYVDDPLTRKKIATCHRTQFKSILDDPDYKTALEYADMAQRNVYEREAAYIDKVQKGILEISNKEQPFDVFICYKETDENGRRTPDSVLAQELYYGLTQEGFKVFFSRITLESKLGTEYEPYIFAALNSAKVMVVVGTKPEYFNAVWVRNEWSRYLMLMQNDRSRTLIPAYKDMDPYDLPDALSMFQAQDMSKLGFMQDLIRGIRKLVKSEPEQPVVQQTVIQQTPHASANVENLLKRGFLSLEDENWDDANSYFEQVLNENVEEPRAYIGKLCAEMKVHKEEELSKIQTDFSGSNHYRKACRFGGSETEKRLFGYIQKGKYDAAMIAMQKAVTTEEFETAKSCFEALVPYKDAVQKARECEQKIEAIHMQEVQAKKQKCYEIAENLMQNNKWQDMEKAADIFQIMPGYQDADELYQRCLVKAKELKEQEEQEHKRRHEAFLAASGKLKKLAVIVAIIVALAAALTMVCIFVVIPNVKYHKAISLYEHGNYKESYDLFSQMRDYKDTEKYLQKEEFAEFRVKIGGVISFGQYEWYVIDKDENTAQLLCKTCVDDRIYSNIHIDNHEYFTEYEKVYWEHSTLRNWLNNDFYREFTEAEQSKIQKHHYIAESKSKKGDIQETELEDYVYLLSIEEAKKLDQTIRSCGKWWWLRSPGKVLRFAPGIGENGEIDAYENSENSKHGVRPSITIQIDESIKVLPPESRNADTIETSMSETQLQTSEPEKTQTFAKPTTATATKSSKPTANASIEVEWAPGGVDGDVIYLCVNGDYSYYEYEIFVGTVPGNYEPSSNGTSTENRIRATAGSIPLYVMAIVTPVSASGEKGETVKATGTNKISNDIMSAAVESCSLWGEINTRGGVVASFASSYVVNGGASSQIRDSLENGWHVSAKRRCISRGVVWYELYDSDDGDYYGWVDANYIDFYTGG